jgi:hypothetical protein
MVMCVGDARVSLSESEQFEVFCVSLGSSRSFGHLIDSCEVKGYKVRLSRVSDTFPIDFQWDNFSPLTFNGRHVHVRRRRKQ